MTIAPAISILIPHLRERANDAALKIALACILDNTDIDYELMVEAVAERRDIYPVLNNMTHRARAEWIVFANSDTFMAPGWASAFYAARDERTIVTGVIVECGVIGVSHLNHHKNFGVTPETFNRAGFEAWVADSEEARDVFQGQAEHYPRGWLFPCLIHKRTWNRFGGFDTSRGTFPKDPVDLYAWDKWGDEGNQFRRSNSWCYHLQAFSDNDPQRIANRARLA